MGEPRACLTFSKLNDIGLVGLGVGTLSAYGHAGQKLTFFEIDPLIERVADRDVAEAALTNTDGSLLIASESGVYAIE